MGRPRKIVDTQEAIKPTKSVETAKEKRLENEVNELKNTVKQMQEMMMAQTKTTVAMPEYGNMVAPVGETVDVPFRQYIKVMSLTKHRLTISTEGFGNGTVFNFTEYGQVQSILYEDLAKIIHNNSRFAREGYFVVMDPRVIKIHNLENEYSKILDKKTIDNILDLDADNIRTLVKNTTPHIKNTIVSTVVEKLLANEYVDLNKVRIVSTESGQDIDSMVRGINSFKQVDEE